MITVRLTTWEGGKLIRTGMCNVRLFPVFHCEFVLPTCVAECIRQYMEA